MLLFVLCIMRASWEGETTQQIMKVELELQARTDEAFAGLKKWVDQRAARVSTDVRERQKKFVDLVRKRDDVTPEQRNNGQGTKVVVNLSRWKTDETEEEVLSLGLNYAIAPRDLPVGEVLARMEAFSQTFGRSHSS